MRFCDYLRALTLALLWPALLPAQELGSEPANEDVQVQPEPAIPEIEETIVPGRIGDFPSGPLGEDTLLSATRSEMLASEVGSSTSVFSESQILRTRQTLVTEILRGGVGIDAVQQGGPGGLTSVFMRGANSQHTKVLLDGIPINDPSNATRGFDFSTLTVDNIERIEVLRGPQSGLYGSDAIGGVVNIVTKRGEGPLTVRASGMGGSLGTSREAVQISGGDDLRYFSLSGSYFDNHGVSAASAAPERDGYNNGTVSGRFGWTPSDAVNLDYVFRYTHADVEVDNFDFFTGLPVDDPNGRQANLSDVFYSRIQLQSFAMDGLIEQKVGFNFADADRRDTEPQTIFNPAQFLGQTREVDWQANFLLTETNVFTVGASYWHEEASTDLQPQVSQNNTGVYLHDRFSMGEVWFATVGVRWDDYSSAGRAETYRVTNLIRVQETGTAFHAALGTGFRAPALAENFFQFGNPDLRPERSKGWDVGAEQQLWGGDVVVDATYFRNDFRDLIVFDFDTFSLQNVGRARSSGVELTLLWRADPCTSVSANYTFTDTFDFDQSRPLLRRPQDKASLVVTRSLLCDQAHLRAALIYVGDRLDTRPFGSNAYPVLDEYFLLNVSGDYDLSDNLRLFARIDNVLDEDYEEVRGFGTPGIAGYAGLELLW